MTVVLMVSRGPGSYVTCLAEYLIASHNVFREPRCTLWPAVI